PCPGCIPDYRNHRLLHRLEGPELAIFFSDLTAANGEALRFARPGSAHLDPLDQRADLGVGQFAIRGHLQVALVPDQLHQETLLWLARENGWAGHASLHERGASIQTQPGFLFLGTMAPETLLGQQRPDFVLEEGGLVRRRFLSPADCTGCQQAHQDAAKERSSVLARCGSKPGMWS